MKKWIILLIFLLVAALCYNVFGQSASYPFEVKKTGSGKRSIIFIPGFASSGDVWNETRTRYEKDYTCYTLTMAGFAGSEPKPGATFQNWEREIARYIKDMKIEKPLLVGHSMGGGLAMAIAADFPDLVGKIIVVDALPCLQALMNPAFKSKEKNDCSEMINKMLAMPDAEFYSMQKMSAPRLLEDTSKQVLVVDWSMKSDRRTFAGMYCDFSNTDLREKIGTITCPSLILLEAYFVNYEGAIKDQYKHLKTADFRFADKGLHFIMYDDRDWYFKQLNEFITSR